MRSKAFDNEEEAMENAGQRQAHGGHNRPVRVTPVEVIRGALMRFSGVRSPRHAGSPHFNRERDEVRRGICFADVIAAHLAWKQRLFDAAPDH